MYKVHNMFLVANQNNNYKHQVLINIHLQVLFLQLKNKIKLKEHFKLIHTNKISQFLIIKIKIIRQNNYLNYNCSNLFNHKINFISKHFKIKIFLFSHLKILLLKVNNMIK